MQTVFNSIHPTLKKKDSFILSKQILLPYRSLIIFVRCSVLRAAAFMFAFVSFRYSLLLTETRYRRTVFFLQIPCDFGIFYQTIIELFSIHYKYAR